MSTQGLLGRLATILLLRAYSLLFGEIIFAAQSFSSPDNFLIRQSLLHTTTTSLRSATTWKAPSQDDETATTTSLTKTTYGHNVELILPILREHSYDRRLLTLSNSQLPLLAEVYHQGQCKLCRLFSFHYAPSKDPKVKIQLIKSQKSDRIDSALMETIDVGQITTIWRVSDTFVQNTTWFEEGGCEKETTLQLENSMNRMYQAHVGRARSSATGLAKKQISEKMLAIPFESRSHVEAILRQLRKAGNGLSRLVDSRAAVPFVYARATPRTDMALQRQAVAAFALAKDAELGGRFKRMPCVLVAYQLAKQQTDEMDQDISISIINGGWLVLDQSVRAGAEARKLVQRIEKQQEGVSLPRTAADDRILHRLECLAMGEVLRWSENEHNDGTTGYSDKQMEVDVREALKTMGFPATAEGAKLALLKIGRWTQDPGQIRLNPWTKDVIDAARWYATMNKQRRIDMQTSAPGQSSQPPEGRVDLRKFPCLCIDASRTSFRDDAIGLRPRSSTGRPLIEGGSKWEVLIHIADVSDIFSPSPAADIMTTAASSPQVAGYLRLLREAAPSRGTSRYDLPLGPLHLMPPVALEELSLQTSTSERTEEHVSLGKPAGVNRCVTIWAYIDDRTGELLDIGFERTVISQPLAFSFAQASQLLVADAVSITDKSTRQASAMLQIVNRSLSVWSRRYQEQNTAAEAREKRLAMKEVVAREISQTWRLRDDGRDGFQRSPGHRLVDTALDLYAHSLDCLLRRAKAPTPRAAGSGESRGGRLGTAPLRRYIDAMVQRQALAALCGFGGLPMTQAQCIEASKLATSAKNNRLTIHSSFKADLVPPTSRARQSQALYLLQTQIVADSNRAIQAVATGRENEVVIVGVGAVAKCKGVDGTLAPGDRIMVRVRSIDPAKGSLSVTFVEYANE